MRVTVEDFIGIIEMAHGPGGGLRGSSASIEPELSLLLTLRLKQE